MKHAADRDAGPPDNLAYYDLERYLFDVVGPRFRAAGSLGAFDLISIVIWKANRAKTRFVRRLMKQDRDLERACRLLTQALHAAPARRERLRILVEDWGLRLPVASSILAVLWPEEFTVYDVRVCGQLGRFGALADRTQFEALWRGYEDYVVAVGEEAPPGLSLRDKDRWLWGKSATEQLRADISARFGLA